MAERESRKNEPTSEAHSPTEMHSELYDDTGSTIWPMVMKLWNYRRTIGWALGCALGVFLLGVALAYVWYPDQKTAQVGFRLLFGGAEKGEYPNGMLFSPTDITSNLIIEEVYEANNLTKYSPFEDFKKSLFIKQENRSLELLEAEFRGKLSDPKLTPVDRQRFERDFEARTRNLTSADFNLVFIRTERFRKMPTTLLHKILSDILSAYARDADKEKGALKYRIPVPTRNMVRQDLMGGEDYIISLDMFRAAINRVQTALNAFAPIPGANTVRVGPTRLSLIDVQSNLEDLLSFRINPMIGLVRAAGFTKNATLTIQYLRDRLFTVGLDSEAVKKGVKVYDENLRNYLQQKFTQSTESAGAQPSGSGGMGNVPALIPQLNDSFFDRLIELGRKGSDTIYRQELVNKSIEEGMKLINIEKEVAYYKDLISTFEDTSKRANPELQKEFLSLYQAKFSKNIEELLVTIDNMILFYDALSQRNLNPISLLVKITVPPSVSTESSLPAGRVLLAALVYFLVVGAGTVVVIFVRDKSRAASAQT